MQLKQKLLLILFFSLFFGGILTGVLQAGIDCVICSLPNSAVHSTVNDNVSFPNKNLPKSHAPEPSSMALVGIGIGGMFLRFFRRRYHDAKRIFDILAAATGLIITSPFLLLAITLIKLNSKGPVFFRQIRVGKDGDVFKIYKLRTMKINAEAMTGPVWAKDNDPRITKIGKFLRKTHLDEIPQLINVLKGEMSLIGPRPERPFFVDEFKHLIPRYEDRLKVKPGITGLAQVRHKYDETLEDVKKKLDYDILYIKRVCLLTDLRIVLSTIFVMLTGKGAR
ncbi:MAG: exopolysaccharide biosynthesis polyprenyl glycosylphosphotransferase [Candidatus Omnitrophota bacterium]